MGQTSGGAVSRRWATVALMALVGAVALTQMACPPSVKRRPGEVQADIDKRNERLDQIRDELETYGGEYDPATGQWDVGMQGPLSLTPQDAQAQIRNLQTEWNQVNNQIRNLQTELQSSQQAYPTRTSQDVSHAGTRAASTTRPPTAAPPSTGGCRPGCP